MQRNKIHTKNIFHISKDIKLHQQTILLTAKQMNLVHIIRTLQSKYM